MAPLHDIPLHFALHQEAYKLEHFQLCSVRQLRMQG